MICLPPFLPYYWVEAFRLKAIEELFAFLDLDRRYFGIGDTSGYSSASGY
jgi:hypothetical protein